MLADLDSLERRIVAMEKKAKGGDKEAKEVLASPSAASPNCARAARRASPASAATSDRKLFAVARPAVVQAGALCLQRRGGLGRQGQRLLRSGREQRRPRRARRLSSSRPRSKARSRCLPRRAEGLSRGRRPRGAGPQPRDPRRLRPAASGDLLHRRAEGGARLDGRAGRARAPQAAGVIHTDFEKGFIRAETIAYDDYVRQGRGGRARGRASSGSKARTMSSRTAT
jgi:hypothetical protein